MSEAPYNGPQIELVVSADQVKAVTGGWGTIDLTYDPAVNGYKMSTRLTFRMPGAVFAIRGSYDEIKALVDQIGQLEVTL